MFNAWSTPCSMRSLWHGPADQHQDRVETMAAGGSPSESALLIPVRTAEPAVQQWRERLDPACTLGVPAHVTLLYPFLPPPGIDDALITRLAHLFRRHAAFPFSLRRVGWFGDEVAYLQPEPAAPFRELTSAIFGEFPAYPPYEGMYDEVIPHLTIGQDAPTDVLREAARNVNHHLPIDARAQECWLMVGTQSARSWVRHTQFELKRRHHMPG